MLTAILPSIDDGLSERVWGLMGIDRNFAMAVSFHIHVDVTGCMMAHFS